MNGNQGITPLNTLEYSEKFILRAVERVWGSLEALANYIMIEHPGILDREVSVQSKMLRLEPYVVRALPASKQWRIALDKIQAMQVFNAGKQRKIYEGMLDLALSAESKKLRLEASVEIMKKMEVYNLPSQNINQTQKLHIEYSLENHAAKQRKALEESTEPKEQLIVDAEYREVESFERSSQVSSKEDESESNDVPVFKPTKSRRELLRMGKEEAELSSNIRSLPEQDGNQEAEVHGRIKPRGIPDDNSKE